MPIEIVRLVNNLDSLKLIEQLKNYSSLMQLILLFYADKLENSVFQKLITTILMK